jgi:hypothetical protein
MKRDNPTTISRFFQAKRARPQTDERPDKSSRALSSKAAAAPKLQLKTVEREPAPVRTLPARRARAVAIIRSVCICSTHRSTCRSWRALGRTCGRESKPHGGCAGCERGEGGGEGGGGPCRGNDGPGECDVCGRARRHGYRAPERGASHRTARGPPARQGDARRMLTTHPCHHDGAASRGARSHTSPSSRALIPCATYSPAASCGTAAMQ